MSKDSSYPLRQKDVDVSENAADIYEPRQGHDRKIRTIHVPTPHGAERSNDESTVQGGQYLIKGALKQSLEASGSPVEEEEIPVDQILKDNGLEYRTEPEEGVKNAPQLVAIGKETAKRVAAAVDEGYLPIIAGGDHSTLIMGLPELLDRHPDPENPSYSSLKLVFIDAHPDILQDPVDDTDDPENKHYTGNAHGRTISTLLGKGAKDLMPLMEGRLKLNPKNLLYIGISKPDKRENQIIKDLKIQNWHLCRIRKDPQGFERAVREFLTVEKGGKQYAAPFFAELDPDVLRKKDSEGTPMVSKFGMSADELNSLALLLAAEGNLAGTGTAELAPKLDKGGKTAACVSDFMYRVLGKGDEYYHEYEAFRGADELAHAPATEGEQTAELVTPSVQSRDRKGWRKKVLGYAAGVAAGIGGLIAGHQFGTQQQTTSKSPFAVVSTENGSTSASVSQASADYLGQFSNSGFRETAARLRLASEHNDNDGIQDALADLARTYQTARNVAPSEATKSNLGRLALSEFVRGFGYSEKLDHYYQEYLKTSRKAA